MELHESINSRCSYRGAFQTGPVPREALREIVQAGIQAPSGNNAQTTSFVILDESGPLRRTLACIGNGPHLQTAPSAVVVVMDPGIKAGRTRSFGIQDYSAAIENILLAITARGYATVWIEGQVLDGGLGKQIADIVGVPQPLEVRAILPIGIPVKIDQQHSKKPFAERAWFNKYGGTHG
jgi:nitroreductase